MEHMGIGKNVKALAKAKGLNLIELSEKSGVPVNTIYTLTQVDPKNATTRTLDKLAKALEVHPETLRTGKEYVSESDKRLKRIKALEKESKLTKLILDIIKTLSTPEDIDWAHIEDLVIEAERLDNGIKEEK
jgi:transcriptional regulator with XRE-family HTH domain